MADAATVAGPASITLPASGVAKCAKAGAPRMTFTHAAKSALHDAALVFVSFAASRSVLLRAGGAFKYRTLPFSPQCQ